MCQWCPCGLTSGQSSVGPYDDNAVTQLVAREVSRLDIRRLTGRNRMGWIIVWNAVWMNALAVTGAAAYGCFWALLINTDDEDEEIEIEDTWW